MSVKQSMEEDFTFFIPPPSSSSPTSHAMTSSPVPRPGPYLPLKAISCGDLLETAHIPPPNPNVISPPDTRSEVFDTTSGYPAVGESENYDLSNITISSSDYDLDWYEILESNWFMQFEEDPKQARERSESPWWAFDISGDQDHSQLARPRSNGVPKAPVMATAPPSPLALSGITGVGKTQIAMEFARDRSNLLWAPSSSSASSTRVRFQLPKIGRSNITRSHLPLGINGLTENAVADTGAQENIISESLAKRLKLAIHPARDGAHHFMNAVGKRMTAIGYTQIPCTFQELSQQTVTSRFWVFKKLVAPLVVGRNFLESTGTLTRFKHRLQNLVMTAGKSLRILHMELPRWRLSCTIDSSPTLANPDTGSDLDLMSLSFVQQNGFKMKKARYDQQYIQLADGSTQRLKGVVSVPFSIGQGQHGNRDHEFHVLDGLTSEVLLGNNTLREFDAFDSYGHEFVDLEEYDEYSDFFFIRWVQRNREGDFLDAPFHEFQFSSATTGMTPSTETPSRPSISRFSFLKMRRRRPQQETMLTIAESEARSQRYLQFKDISEQRRRTEEEARISRLELHDQSSAARAEHIRQHQYDHDRADFVVRHTAAINLLKSGRNSS